MPSPPSSTDTPADMSIDLSIYTSQSGDLDLPGMAAVATQEDDRADETGDSARVQPPPPMPDVTPDEDVPVTQSIGASGGKSDEPLEVAVAEQSVAQKPAPPAPPASARPRRMRSNEPPALHYMSLPPPSLKQIAEEEDKIFQDDHSEGCVTPTPAPARRMRQAPWPAMMIPSLSEDQHDMPEPISTPGARSKQTLGTAITQDVATLHSLFSETESMKRKKKKKQRIYFLLTCTVVCLLLVLTLIVGVFVGVVVLGRNGSSSSQSSSSNNNNNNNNNNVVNNNPPAGNIPGSDGGSQAYIPGRNWATSPPTPFPTPAPSERPPTPAPIVVRGATFYPTITPSKMPTAQPSSKPSAMPSAFPSAAPSTPQPSSAPSRMPSRAPVWAPVKPPSIAPNRIATIVPKEPALPPTVPPMFIVTFIPEETSPPAASPVDSQAKIDQTTKLPVDAGDTQVTNAPSEALTIFTAKPSAQKGGKNKLRKRV